MIVSEALANRRDWREVEVDPLPMPIILGEVKNEPPPTIVWWKLIGSVAAIVAASGAMYYGAPALVAALGDALPATVLAAVSDVGTGMQWGALVAAGPVIWAVLNA